MVNPRSVPVLLIAFNRPWHTAQVWEAMRKWQPERLLVAMDAPRPGMPSDVAACQAVRKLVQAPDWGCELSVRCATSHQSCRHGPAGAISWAFEQTEQAIVLEDDCVPDLTFFPYCAELLERYRNHPQVMGIGGHRWEAPDLMESPSYYASRYPNTWGWASWADRWAKFDLAMAEWPGLRASGWLQGRFSDPAAVAYWQQNFNAMESGLDTWDLAWLFACWRQEGVWLRPNVNLVQNIGFGPDATHTLETFHPAGRAASAMPLPLHHPEDLKADPNQYALLEWVTFSGMLKRQLHTAVQRISEKRAARPA